MQTCSASTFKAPIYDTTMVSAGGDRRPSSGTTEQIAGNIAAHADLRVSELVFDVRSANMADLERIERFAATIMPATR